MELTKQYVFSMMKKTEQTKGQSILQHGYSVKNWTLQVISDLKLGIGPKILLDNKERILTNLLPNRIIKEYTILHDIGKPFCKSEDEKGQHFYNHAEVSAQIYNKLWDNPIVSALIEQDMDIHLAKSADIEELSKRPYIITQIIVSYAELLSNSQMFGGTDTVSFKIKYKNWERITKKLWKTI